MRTTVTLDDDPVARLKHRASPKPFRVKRRRIGPPRVDITKATGLAARMEDEEIVRKMRPGK